MTGLQRRFVYLSVAMLSMVCALYACTSTDKGFRLRSHEKNIQLKEDDVAAEIQFGREVAARILGMYGLYDKERLTRYVSLVGETVAHYVGRPELEYHFAVLKTDSINAYAAPGGYIFITRGALLQMKNEAELASVIAHEMAHVNRKHIVKELNIFSSDNSPVAGFARFLGGAGDPTKMTFLKTVDKAVEILFERGYKIEDEEEADSTAIIYLSLAGYDPAAFAEYLENIKDKKRTSVSVMSKTHPPFEKRIDAVTEVMEEEGLDSNNYRKSKDRFDEIKNII